MTVARAGGNDCIVWCKRVRASQKFEMRLSTLVYVSDGLQ